MKRISFIRRSRKLTSRPTQSHSLGGWRGTNGNPLWAGLWRLFLAHLLLCMVFHLFLFPRPRWLNKWRRTFFGQLRENIACSLPAMCFLLAGKLPDTISGQQQPSGIHTFHCGDEHDFNTNCTLVVPLTPMAGFWLVDISQRRGNNVI